MNIMVCYSIGRIGVFCQSSITWAFVGVALLALAPAGQAQVPLDGWGTDGFIAPPITLAASTIGATVGPSSLQSTANQGSFWGTSTGNLITGTGQGPGGTPLTRLPQLQQATRISFDLTLLSAQINGGSGNFSGFAQANEMVFQLFSGPVPTLPAGINLFTQRNFATGNGTDSLNQNATWSGEDGTRTITFDLTAFTGVDPSDGVTKPLAAILLAHPDIQDAKFGFVQQTGGGTPVGPSNFFYDNVRLLGAGGVTLATIGNFEPIPEPTSLLLASLAIPVYAAVRRRRRSAAVPA
jgi:hypothetical protein